MFSHERTTIYGAVIVSLVDLTTHGHVPGMNSVYRRAALCGYLRERI